MEFRYSIELPADENPTAGLAGKIPVRRHRSPLSEDIGAIRAQQDWQKLVGPLQDFRGGLSGKYGLIQVAVPECLPERLEIIAYASEMGFLYDDCTEALGHKELSDANDDMQSAFMEGMQASIDDSNASGLKMMQQMVLKEMVAIDKPRALVAVQVWVEFLQEAAGRQHKTCHTSIDEYLKYRVLDVGEMFWFGLVTFGMGLTIPEKELPLLRKLTRPCWVVLALQNDICSYAKELDAALANGAKDIVNALWVLVKYQNLSLERAVSFCRRKINICISEYQQSILAHKDDDALCSDAKTYMQSLLYTMSGDAAWSLITPRYNLKQTYNAMQLKMMRNGGKNTMQRLEIKDWRSSKTRAYSARSMPQSHLASTTAELIALHK